MTEQEKRERATNELYDTFKKWANENYITSYSGATVMSVPSVEGLLTRIVHYIICKSEEVQKETAKEVLLHFKKLCDNLWHAYDLTIDDIWEIADKFGVEVSDE